MQELRDKVAVITGGASGIGRALADRCLEEGVKIVLADIEQAALDKAAGELANAGADVLAVRTDVSKNGSVEDLAKRVLDRYGAVHLLFNNAGVASSGSVWQNTLADWEWVLGVNLMGVVHGIRTFVPIMLSQDADAHIVNTASMAGLLSTPGLGIYNVTKHGVVTLSETLALELQQARARINVSVLCPGWVKTQIWESSRNRPDDLRNGPTQPSSNDPAVDASSAKIPEAIATGISPEQVADVVFDAIRRNRFYILTHPNWKPLIQQRMEHILNDRGPASGFGSAR
jgi:NAD(P)-dependent dehydrogenase (short-subunit alcohol dehydrogenase family)